MHPKPSNPSTQQARLEHRRFLFAAMLLAALLLPQLVLAQTVTSDESGTLNTACGFFSNVQLILNVLSLVVVTIAVLFTGYKVAFAHARIAEVAPVLIGAILIGAAGQIAKIFLSKTQSSSTCSNGVTTMLIHDTVSHLAAVVHAMAPYA